MNDELGVRELAGAKVIQKPSGANGENVKLCANGVKETGGISEVEPSCQSSPETTHHASDDGPKCEPIAIIGMGCRLPGGASSPSKLWDLLTEARSGYCDIPNTRFNIDSFHHPNPNRMGTTNTKGGYFLSEDITSFENQFFGINNREATSMDPQQRKLLEVVFECFENAGMSMEALAGANVGCYVGNFTADFATMQNKDPDLFTRYSAAGMGATILANRLSHIFDLRGPSLVLDTACSSSLYCLHVACTALALRECDGAVVAGVNLIQGPEHHLAIVKAGILSASSTCNTFDVSAEGYGRADGVGALYIKRLGDALRDGDPVRSVIRATAVNSNGHTNGITLPSVDGQEAVIRKAYAKAGLDVSGTHYVECHGTGTAVGDPIEVEALSRIFGESHSKIPLLIGSVKTNIGHSEAASGITSIIKTTMALEQGLIPATIGLGTLNPKIKASEWNVKVVTEQTPWRQLSRSTNKETPRASVNSFGFGGANAHAIIEAAVVDLSSHLSSIPSPNMARTPEPLMILPFSASNRLSLQDRVATLSALDTSSVSLRDLSHTLGSRRSHLPLRGYITVEGKDWKGGLKFENLHTSEVNSRHAQLPYAFVFSGQGGQWPEMGRQLLDRYPSFQKTIRDLDENLACLPYPPDFSIHDVIRERAETSRINIASYSQPVCTAVQIALVNLLAEFNVLPTAVVGHSSGEISAAYAAGHISANAAIVIAYYRGYAMSQVSHQGAMIAMGLNQLAAEELIAKIGVCEGVFVACVNSPESVTLSGDTHYIDTIVTAAQVQGIFTRRLRTDDKAYHSPHMTIVGKQYEELIEDVLTKGSRCQLNETQDPGVSMISSVTGRMVGPEQTCTAAYWRSNLESRVLFKAAIEFLAPASEAFDFVEVGPHPVLELPVKQTLAKIGPIFYSSTLIRGKDGIVTMLDLIGKLFVRGHAISFDKVNGLFPLKPGLSKVPKVLRDLPTYRWQYDSKLWTEPRLSEEYRYRQYPPHDLLGARVINGSSLTATWRKLLSAENVEYAEDHKLGSAIVLPGAAYLAIAVEASCQLADSSVVQCATLFRHVDILKALTIPSTGTIELFTELRPASISNITISTDSWEFTIFSVSSKNTVTHAKGLVQIDKTVHPVELSRPQTNDLLEPLAISTVYDRWATRGLVFGARFQSLTEIYHPRAKGQRIAMAKTPLHKGGNTGIQHESVYRVHPITLDAVFQTGLVADAAGSVENLRAAVPVSIDHVRIANSMILSDAGTIYAKARRVGFDASIFDAHMCDEDGQKLVEFHGVRMITYPGVEGLQVPEERHPYLRVIWKPDVLALLRNNNNVDFARALNQNTSPHQSEALSQGLDALSTSLDLIAHKKPTIRVLELAHEPGTVTHRLLDMLNAETSFRRFQTYTLGSIDAQGQLFGRNVRGASDVKSENTEHLALTSDAEFDVFILLTTTSGIIHPDLHFQTLSSHAAPGAVMLFLSESRDVPPPKAETFDETLSCPVHSGITACLMRITEPTRVPYELSRHAIFLVDNGSACASFTTLCTKLTETLKVPLTVLRFDQVSEATLPPNAIVIATVELETPLLKTATEIDLVRIKVLIERASTMIWVTGGGLLQGKRPDLALYAGLSRAVGLEQPSTKLIAFDVDDYVSDPNKIADHVVGILDQSLHDPTPDYEYMYHNGNLHISRFMPDEKMNRDYRQGGKATRVTTTWEQAGRCQLAIDRVGQLDTLHFEQVCEPESQLRPEFVEVQVKFIGLNAKDVYALNGKFDTKDSTCTSEYCGIVTSVGSAVTDLVPGDRVVVTAPGYFKAYERVPTWACQKLRIEEDFSAACTLMVVFVTALYGLQDRACLQAGESILIHSASGGAGLAAIQIAKLIGAEVYATVGTAEKEQFLIESMGVKPENIFSSRESTMLPGILKATNGRGVDVVFNSLTGEMLHDSWRALALFGRFVEIGKRDILEGGKLDMRIFKRGATFTAFDLTEIFYSSNPEHHHLWQRLCSRVLELYRADKITAIQPSKTFGVSDLVRAIRYFSSSARIGKVVLSLDDPSSQITFRPPRYATVLSPLKSYIMVGCLGGLGRSLSRWMFDRGARSFVFLGRSGADKPTAKKLVEDLQQSGAAVVVVRGDVSCLDDVQNAVMQSACPIGGIVQASMGLNEAIFTEMSQEFWHSGIDAKVLGTWNLHTAMVGNDDQLDFFLMTSSISGTIGSATEGNYCAGNHFLDNFAKYRRNLGLPATSIGLGMISEVGYLHEHPEIEALLLRKGIRPLNEKDMLGVFDVVLSQPQTPSDDANRYAGTHLLTGFEVTGLRSHREQGFDGHIQALEDPRASVLLQSFNDSSPQLVHGGSIGKGLSGKIKEAVQSGGDLRKTIHDAIAGKMSNLILLPANDIKPETTLSTFGMDSMLAAELRTYIYQASAVDVPFQTLMGDATSISGLTDMIIKEITKDQRRP